MKKHNISITESEWKVMQIIWENPPRTLKEIVEQLECTQWSKTTIQTYLARLVKKGALTTERKGKGYLYSPLVSEQECRLFESRSFLQRIYGGSLYSMVSGFVNNGALSQDELDALKKLIDEQEHK